MTQIVNKYKDTYNVLIDRSTMWGNPFSSKEGTKALYIVGSKAEAIECYRAHILTDPTLYSKLHTIKDKILGCTCKPQPCHGDVLVDLCSFLGTRLYARIATNGYEVSSKGDTTYSPLYAKLKDGRTIEEAYQLDVKGYRSDSNDWKYAKGKSSKISYTPEQLYNEYLKLWMTWGMENPHLLVELGMKSHGKVLTDMFGHGEVTQARALCDILNQLHL